MATKVKSIARRRTFIENGIRYSLAAISAFSIFVLFLVALFLIVNALPAFRVISLDSFFTGTIWDPTSPLKPLYGIIPLFVATLLVTLISALVAIPIGLGCTIYLAELAHPRVRAILKPAVEVLAGIPSVVLGFFALIVLATWVQDIFDPVNRLNLFVGGVMLSAMMIPIMVSLSEDAINSVPRSLKEASYALGTTRWETISKVILPAAKPGIVAAIMLSIGRAVGETMVVVMACGNAPHLTFNIFSSGLTMTATIANEMGEVAFNSTHYYALFAVGLVLFAITFILNYVADIILNRQEERY
jgi:phosphate ABC transporter permease protein PstC